MVSWVAQEWSFREILISKGVGKGGISGCVKGKEAVDTLRPDVFITGYQ